MLPSRGRPPRPLAPLRGLRTIHRLLLRFVASHLPASQARSTTECEVDATSVGSSRGLHRRPTVSFDLEDSVLDDTVPASFVSIGRAEPWTPASQQARPPGHSPALDLAYRLYDEEVARLGRRARLFVDWYGVELDPLEE